jgi:hypothetical protein
MSKAREIFDIWFNRFRECGWEGTDMPREDITEHFKAWVIIIYDTAKSWQVLTDIVDYVNNVMANHDPVKARNM